MCVRLGGGTDSMVDLVLFSFFFFFVCARQENTGQKRDGLSFPFFFLFNYIPRIRICFPGQRTDAMRDGWIHHDSPAQKRSQQQKEAAAHAHTHEERGKVSQLLALNDRH